MPTPLRRKGKWKKGVCHVNLQGDKELTNPAHTPAARKAAVGTGASWEVAECELQAGTTPMLLACVPCPAVLASHAGG